MSMSENRKDWLVELRKRQANIPGHKEAQLNFIFENPLFESLIRGALKGMMYVALITFDMRLGIITKMLESWVEDRKKEWDDEQEKRRKINTQPEPTQW